MISRKKINREIDALSEDKLKEIQKLLDKLSGRDKKAQFSFNEARNASKNFKGSLSDTLIAERRGE